MKAGEIALVMIFSVGMGLGQIIFKFVAQRQAENVVARTLVARLFSLMTDWTFLAGALLYGLMLVYWVWLQTFLPLSRSYPFTLLSIVIAAAGGYFLFKETVSPTFLAGISIVAVGLVVMSWE